MGPLEIVAAGRNVRCVRPGESKDDVQRKIDRWRAGEDVEDVTPHPTTGDELIVVFRNFG